MIDIHAFSDFLSSACEQYEKTAPAVCDWLDDLYRRIGKDTKQVTLYEMQQALKLYEDGMWEHPNYAANRQYHVMEYLGVATVGHAGF